MNYGDLDYLADLTKIWKKEYLPSVVCSFDPETFNLECYQDTKVSDDQKKEESDLPPTTRIVNWRD